MDKTSKGTKDDLAETLQQLLQAKDNINSRLLADTKQNGDLVNQISSAENQLRELTENALRHLRTEVEEKRKGSIPAIKRLEDTLKELKKSERALSHRTSHKRNKTSEIKRAKRRIKDAEKTLKEIPKVGEVESVYKIVVEQVTQLCQRLMQIPMSISFQKNSIEASFRTKSPLYVEESDDTDTANSDNETNGSYPLKRPRANSDTKSETSLIKTRGYDKPKLQRNQFDKTHKKLPGNNMYNDPQKTIMDKFEAIGFIPNGSDSSEGSIRGDSPGPLRGYPLSNQRRPSSAGRAERHFYTRDRSSSLPLLNARRCRTPTPSSSGSFVATNDMQPNRVRFNNGVSTTSHVLNRRERMSFDSHTIRHSPLDRQLLLTEKPTRRKTSPISHCQLNKDEILTSYERDARYLVTRQSKMYSPSESQSKLSSSEGSDSPKGEYQESHSDKFGVGTKKDETNAYNSGIPNNDNNRRNDVRDLRAFADEINVDGPDNPRSNANQRLTPKRLLPKVPATKMAIKSQDVKTDQVPNSGSRHDTSSPEVTVSDAQKPVDRQSEALKTEIYHSELKGNTKENKSQMEHKSSDIRSKNTNYSPEKDANLVLKTHTKQIDNAKEKKTEEKHLWKSGDTDDKRRHHAIETDTRGLDIEEIKFKENVRTARREIIDKLRSKYALPRLESPSNAHVDTSDLKFDASGDIDDNMEDNQMGTNLKKVDNKTKAVQNIETHNESLKSESICKHVPLNNATERHSPVMSIAGLKRYKSTTNLSKLESFDKATSKFDVHTQNALLDKCERSDSITKEKNIAPKNTNDTSQISGTDENSYANFTENLSKSLTFEKNTSVLLHIPLDRQGLLRSASVENVDTCQFIDTLSSAAHLNESAENKLKESGISTMSINDLSLISTDELSGADLNESSNGVTSLNEAKPTTSSSDNDFDSGEGLGNSEDSVDDLDTEPVGLKATKLVHSPILYPAKLIRIDRHSENNTPVLKTKLTTEPTRNETKTFLEKIPDKRFKSSEERKPSNVRCAVEKLENTLFTRSRPEKRTLKQFKENSKERNVHTRSRSASASRNPASVYGDIVFPATKALCPRNRFGSVGEAVDQKPSLASIFYTVKKSRSIEADLNKICQEETAEGIRKEWIQRRSFSSSRTPRKATLKVPTVDNLSVFEFDKSYVIPSQKKLRSNLSGIISLQNGRFVILDQLQMSLYLLSSEFRAVYESSLEYIPCGICVTGSSSFAIAFPYKSLIRVFYVVKDRVTHTRDITLSCKEWINDINHRKGRIHVLCKAGHIHILGITGKEEGAVETGITGKLQLNEAGNRFYIHGDRSITRFNEKGEVIWTRSDMNASCILLYNDKLYIADTDKKRILTVSEVGDTRDLLSTDTGYVSAICVSHSADKLYICQYSDELDDESTRRVNIYRKRVK